MRIPTKKLLTQNFRHGEVKHDFERLYEFMNEDGQGFTVGIDEQIPQ